jgi:hypothetical protein
LWSCGHTEYDVDLYARSFNSYGFDWSNTLEVAWFILFSWAKANIHMLSFILVVMKLASQPAFWFLYHQYLFRWNLYCNFRLFPSNSHKSVCIFSALSASHYLFSTKSLTDLSDHSRTCMNIIVIIYDLNLQ